MNISRTLKFVAVGALALAVAFSCKKKSEDDTQEYLDGYLTYVVPSFMAAGSSAEIQPTGVSYDDGKIPGFFWYTSLNTVKDTTRYEGDPASVLGNFTITIPEDYVGDVTLTVSAYATGYYLKTQASTITVINQDKSLYVPGLSDEDPVFVDERDGKSYRYVSLGGLDWFARNLSYKAGYPAMGTELLRDIYGSVFSWEEAKTACPDGWRLPTGEDWKSLAIALGANPSDKDAVYRDIAGALMVNATFNGDDLWEYNNKVKISGTSKFNALPVGYAIIDNGACQFSDYTKYAVFWTADDFDKENALYRYLYVASPDMNISAGNKEVFAASVRCVRNSE